MRTSARKIVDPAQGFTLIEVLLGVLIFSIFSLSLYSTFAAGLRLNKKIEKPLRIQRDTFWAIEQMSSDLENMIFYDFSSSYPNKKGFFSDHESIEFFMPTGKGLKAVRYALQSVNEGTIHKTGRGITTEKNVAIVVTKKEEEQKLVALIREEQEFKDFVQSGFEGAPREVMSRHVPTDGFKIFYTGAIEQESKQGGWKEEWTKNMLPQGVRIELTMMADNSPGKVTFRRDVLIPIGAGHEE